MFENAIFMVSGTTKTKVEQKQRLQSAKIITKHQTYEKFSLIAVVYVTFINESKPKSNPTFIFKL